MKIVVLGSKGTLVADGAGGIERVLDETAPRLAAQGHVRSRTMRDWDTVTREFLQLYAASAPARNGITT